MQVMCLEDPALYALIDEVVKRVNTADPTQQTETTKGTLFGFYNSITGYYQNVKEYKTGEVKLNSILFGTGLLRSQAAFKLCEQVYKQGDTMLN